MIQQFIVPKHTSVDIVAEFRHTRMGLLLTSCILPKTKEIVLRQSRAHLVISHFMSVPIIDDLERVISAKLLGVFFRITLR